MPEDGEPKDFGIPKGKAPTIATKHLCRLINLSQARVAQLAQEGILIKEERGRFDLFQSINSYIEYLQTRKVNQWGTKDEGETDFERERLRRTKEEADKLEIFNARSRAELVEVDKVKKLGEKVMAAMKTRLLNMPMTEEQKDQCLRDLLSLKEMDFSDD